MPRTKTEKMRQITLYVPEALYQYATEMGQADGWSEAAFARQCWLEGFESRVEKSNKLLVNRQLRAKLSKQSEVEDPEE